MNVPMEEEMENVSGRRPRRLLVYPFLEIENQEENDIFELKRGGTDMVEVVEVSKDGRLLSIREDPEVYGPDYTEK